MKMYLFITQIYPSGLTGTSVKTRNTIDYLLEKGHKVDVICVHHQIMIKTPYEHPNLRIFYTAGDVVSRLSFKHFLKVLRVILSPLPYRIIKMFSQKLSVVIGILRESNEYDQIFFDGFSTLQYAKQYESNQIYIDDEDITDLMWQRFQTEKNILLKIFYYLEYLKCGWYERKYLRRVSQIWSISPNTHERLKKLSHAKTTLMPTVIAQRRSAFRAQSKDVVFTGLLNWMENINGLKWFLENCWSEINDTFPKTKLHVVGQLADEGLKAYLQNFPQVIFHGYVPDLEEVYQQSAVAVTPIWINCGIKIKTLTYLSYGLPVVSSAEAVWGMESDAGVVVADKQKFSLAVKKLLKDSGQRKKLSRAGRKNIQAHHSNTALEKFFAKVGL